MPTGGGWDTGVGGYPQMMSSPTCAHGVGWANPCASCGRGYPSPVPTTVVSQMVDLTPLIERLDRIEKLLAALTESDHPGRSKARDKSGYTAGAVKPSEVVLPPEALGPAAGSTLGSAPTHGGAEGRSPAPNRGTEQGSTDHPGRGQSDE